METLSYIETLEIDTRQEQAKLMETISKFFGVNRYQDPQDITGVWAGSVAQEMKELGLMIAGGTINSIFTNQKVNDLDFYCRDWVNHEKAKTFFQKYFPEVRLITKNAVTYKRKSDRSNKTWTVQLITRFHGSPEEIMDWFDFTITHGIYCFTNDRFYFGKRFFPDLAKKRLVYAGLSMYPICAMYRTKKYQERGYYCPGSTIMHISLSIIRLDIKTYAQLKEQLMGIDTSYLQGLLEKECFSDHLPVDYGKFLEEAFASINGFSEEDTKEELELANHFR